MSEISLLRPSSVCRRGPKIIRELCIPVSNQLGRQRECLHFTAMDDLHRIVSCIGPSSRYVYCSVTHCCKRFSASVKIGLHLLDLVNNHLSGDFIGLECACYIITCTCTLCVYTNSQTGGYHCLIKWQAP